MNVGESADAGATRCFVGRHQHNRRRWGGAVPGDRRGERVRGRRGGRQSYVRRVKGGAYSAAGGGSGRHSPVRAACSRRSHSAVV